MFGKFFEKMNRPKEQLSGPREIDFENGIKLSVSIEGANKEPRFKLMKNGVEIHDFKSDAPEGTEIKLSPRDKWEADFDGMIIHVGRYKDVDGLLGFLHEAGHLHDNVSAELALTARRRNSQEIIKNRQNCYSNKRLLAMKEERKAVISAERNAWAFALKKIRKLEREFGISILKRMGKVNDVVQYVNNFLNTYEQSYLDELDNINIFTKEEMEKLFAEIEQNK